MTGNNTYTTKYEVLAPAGSYKCMVAAFNAGADAVYLGGSMFGARAGAENFTDEELIRAIDYAHIRDKKIYLTVNTLLKNIELENQLYDYIKPLYEAGLDAVIVQDLGVLEFIKRYFPDIDIHASTQMTVTGKEYAKKLKNEGITRIVPARELSTEEIQEIYKNTKLEIECFVHGALCYCYSGMCLFSSIIGGRSGNRGRCAQPCRLPYDIQFKDGYVSGEYPLSPADLCTLNILPDILESGVYSLKIEGRMKKPEYVASVVSMYRKYVDMYEKKGRVGYNVKTEDIQTLMDIYNRGEFTEGYYKRHNGPEIMSTKRPNHSGTKAAVILSYDRHNGLIKAKALEELHRDDVLEIFSYAGVNKDIEINGITAKAGEVFSTRISERINADLKGQHIMRTRNNKLISAINAEYISNDSISKVYIGGNVVVCAEQPVTIDVWYGDAYAHIEGDIPLAAQNRPVSEEDIRKQISKTGGTDFAFHKDMLNITVENGLFINIKELNRLRREVLEQLKETICLKYHRIVTNSFCGIHMEYNNTDEEQEVATLRTTIVSSLDQFKVVVNHPAIDIIYFEADIVDDYNSWNELIIAAHNNKKNIYMALPYIFRSHSKKYFERNLDFLKNNDLDGYLFRNMEEIYWFQQQGIDHKRAVFDNTIYGFNNEALWKLSELEPYMMTASYELNSRELSKLNAPNIEVNIYGNIPVMISAGCIKKNYDRCDKRMSVVSIKDRLGNYFKTVNHCKFCYNILYNSRPTILGDIIEECRRDFMAYRYYFTTETPEEVSVVLEGKYTGDFTRGHFKRGVE